MKQHITQKQLDELSPRQREVLQLWWDKNYKEEMTILNEMQGGYDPILSIGQMIEFLIGKQRNLDFRFMLNCHDQIDTKTMCDELWEEIKKTLDYKY